MPVDSKAAPTQEGGASPTSHTKSGRFHSLKRRHPSKHAIKHKARQSSKTGVKQENHDKPSSGGRLSGTTVTLQTPERGLADPQPVGFKDAVAHPSEGPASPVSGRVITARHTIKTTGGNLEEVVPDSKNASKGAPLCGICSRATFFT
ncbi:uncharacterized protein LOC144095178 [Amblyomma americanum]